jgi:hypothetical protein
MNTDSDSSTARHVHVKRYAQAVASRWPSRRAGGDRRASASIDDVPRIGAIEIEIARVRVTRDDSKSDAATEAVRRKYLFLTSKAPRVTISVIKKSEALCISFPPRTSQRASVHFSCR